MLLAQIVFCGWSDMRKTVVAIFEDNLVNRYIYEKMFRTREDLTLFVFDNAEKGYEKLRQNPADVVFIEAHFYTNFGGISVLQKIRPLLPDQTVYIAITSLLQKGDLELLVNAGFTICLEKPIVFDDILTRKD